MHVSLVLVVCCMLAQVSSASPSSRDKYTWPFASWSIWNLPIGASAVYVPAQLGVAQQQGLAVDPDIILMNPNSPPQPIYKSSALWSGSSRCTPDAGNQVLYTPPMPSNFIVPSDGSNYGAAILLSDNNTFYQTQPLCKCSSSGVWTSGFGYGINTLDQDGIYGAHGGSGLSTIGGTIRVGELLPGAVIRHALKVNLDAAKHYYNAAPCYRWPASQCDNYYQSNYGGTVPQVKPGALLAIPASVNINNMGLQTQAGASLAWTFQNYGGYLADDTYNWDKFTVETEFSPAGDVRKDFQSVYGYSMESGGTTFASDVAKIYAALAVVDNWDFSTYSRVKGSNGGEGAGGGAPRQSWAPPLTGPSAPTSGPVSAYTIYDDSVASGWSLSSGGILTSVTSPKYAGTSSEKMTTKAAWDDYVFNHAGFSTTGYTHLHLAVLSGQFASICLTAQAFHGSWSSSVPQANMQGFGGAPNPNSWTVYNIPLSYLNPSGATIQSILLQDCSGTSGNTFYIDQLQFTTGAYSSTTAISSSTTTTATTTTATSSTTTTTATSTTTKPTTTTTTTKTVTSSTTTATSTTTKPTTSTTTTTTSTSGSTTSGGGTTYMIFDESIAVGWGLSSAGLLTAYSADKYSGSISERLVTSDEWQNYNFNHNGFSTAGYQYLRVALKSGQAANICFEIQAYHGAWSNTIPHAYLSDYGGNPINTAWKLYNIPVSVLNPSGATIQTILLSDCSGSGGHTFYMDQLQFIPSTAPALVLFDETVANGWSLVAGNGGTVALVTTQAYSGTHSEQLTCPGTWQNYGFYSATAYSLAGKTTLSFAMRSAQSAERCVRVQAYYGNWVEGLPVADLSSYGGYPISTQWRVYNIPMAVFATSSIQSILISDCSGTASNSFYLDQVQLY